MKYSALTAKVKRRLLEFSAELEEELTGNILPFWIARAQDRNAGGFYGILKNDNSGDPKEPRPVLAAVCHLWTYSAAARLFKRNDYLEAADYAYACLVRQYPDPLYGGFYWSVGADGKPIITRKQTGAQALGVSALAEYAAALHELRPDAAPQDVAAMPGEDKAAPGPGGEALYEAGLQRDSTGPGSVLRRALRLFGLLELNSRDTVYGGYFEACDRNWGPASETRLAEGDIDCDKSMQTNLAIVDAVISLRRALRLIHPENQPLQNRVGEALEAQLRVITEKIVGKDGHLDLYFIRDWTVMTGIVSFGHDIEASWLLSSAAAELHTPALRETVQAAALRLAETVLAEGFDRESRPNLPNAPGTEALGALDFEIRRRAGAAGEARDRTRVWWCQAESLAGFFNAWELTGEEKYLNAVLEQWQWIRAFQRDAKGGDWFWAVSPQGEARLDLPKGGNGKTSYHNGRACMELFKRITRNAAAGSSLHGGIAFDERLAFLTAAHIALVKRQNLLHDTGFPGAMPGGLVNRYRYPALTLEHIPLSWRYDLDQETNPALLERMGLAAVDIAGGLMLKKTCRLVVQLEGSDGKCFFAAAESPTGIDRFTFPDYPLMAAPAVERRSPNLRLTQHEDGWIYGIFASRKFLRTRDLKRWEGLPDFKPPFPGNRHITLHPALVEGKYLFYTYPQDPSAGNGSQPRIGMVFAASAEAGSFTEETALALPGNSTLYYTAAAAPVKTAQGWLHILPARRTSHGIAGRGSAGLALLLTSLEDPRQITAAPGTLLPLGEEPESARPVFGCGLIAGEEGKLFIYYRTAHTRIEVAESSVDRMLDCCLNSPPDALNAQDAFNRRLALIRQNQIADAR
ncbi:MAG: AGE family epimerase/isomerase [Treponema sp.]|jgi:4-O-beta-D-mannosyl-D-glucose phosphorylase|nr:AGE family epimerase/isomerase [Treponema sp.]